MTTHVRSSIFESILQLPLITLSIGSSLVFRLLILFCDTMCIIPLSKMSNVHGDWRCAVKRVDILHFVQTMLLSVTCIISFEPIYVKTLHNHIIGNGKELWFGGIDSILLKRT